MRTYLPLFSCLVLCSTLTLPGQTVFWQDNFEGMAPNLGGGIRNAPNGTSATDGSDQGTCGSSDYFYRTDCNTSSSTGSDCRGVSEVFTGVEGSFMWRGEDLDGCVVDPDMIDFTGIDITGRSNLVFLGLFASDNDANDWEGPRAADGHPDFLRVDYQIDGGGYQEGLIFRSDGSDHPNTGDDRGLLRVDTDGDGLGDGPIALGLVFQEANFIIPGTGSTLDLRFVAFVNGGGEEFAIDNFRVAEDASLPVEWLSVAGKLENGDAVISWSTGAEWNNEGFAVERSVDGKHWVQLGFVAGAATNNTTNYYHFTDEKVLPGKHYYRLQQVDFDDAFSYSPIVPLTVPAYDSPFAQVVPNPIRQGMLMTVDYVSPTSGVAVWTLYDTFGKLVLQDNQWIQVGSNEVILRTSGLPAGNYFLRIQQQGSMVSQLVQIIE